MTYSHNTTDFALSFTAFLTAIETKAIIKALPQLFLFCEALLAGHGAADMFLVNIFFCDPNTVHRLFLQCRHVSQLNSGNAAFDGSFVRNRPVQGKRLLIVRTGMTLISHCRNPRCIQKPIIRPNSIPGDAPSSLLLLSDGEPSIRPRHIPTHIPSSVQSSSTLPLRIAGRTQRKAISRPSEIYGTAACKKGRTFSIMIVVPSSVNAVSAALRCSFVFALVRVIHRTWPQPAPQETLFCPPHPPAAFLSLPHTGAHKLPQA